MKVSDVQVSAFNMNNRKPRGYEKPTESFLKAHSKTASNEVGKDKKCPSGTDSRKIAAHSGLKFKVELKKTVVKPFSFDSSSSPKKEKGTASPSKKKSVEKSGNADEKGSADSESQKKVVNDTLKISRSIEHKSKEKSPPVKEKVIESVIHKTTLVKTPCSRCSRATKLLSDSIGCGKEEHPEVAKDAIPLKTVKSEAQPLKLLKASKIQTLQSSKMTKIETHCSKARKVEITKTSVEVSNASKANSCSIKSEKTEANLKRVKSPQLNKCTEKSECLPSNSRMDATITEKSGSANGEKFESVCSDRETAECVPPLLKDVESDVSNTGRIELVNGGTPEFEHAIIADAEFKIFNGTSSESEISNGIKNELNATKVASKIPRITSANPPGLKCPSKREAIPESFSSENRCPNMENQPTNNEDSVLVN